MAHEDLELWAGLVEVAPLPGNEELREQRGAFANAVTLAVDAADYRARIEGFFRREGFDVVSLEAVERLADRERTQPLPAELRRLGALARETGAVLFDRYFGYDAPEA